ncbi:MAG: M28 family peptidase [Rikenellaceae bacterium]
MKKLLLSAALLMGFSAAFAQKGVVEKIIEIGKNDNQTTEHLYTLTSRFGGRMAGSDAYENALEWIASEFEEWGLEVSIEEAGEVPVGFNRGGWWGRLLGGETAMDLHFVTPSFTSGTRGIQRGHVVIEPYSTQEFETMKGTIKDAWVLVGGMNVGWAIDASKETQEKNAEIIAKNDEISKKNREIMMNNRMNRTNEPLLELEKVPGLFYNEMVEAGALGFVQSATTPLRALYDKNVVKNPDMTFDKLSKVCDIKLDCHQYDKIYQMVKEYRDIELEFDIRNNFKMGPIKYNSVVGKLKGSKYPDEYIIISGHLDAFDVATGAVDCGVGITPMMEVARMLTKAGAKPERSILFIGFAAEEFGLIGAEAWCKANADKLDGISNVFNRDGGPTPPTGIAVPKSMVKEFEEICEPINSIHPGIPFKVTAMEPMEKPKQTGGHDGTVFMVRGIPAISFDLPDVLGYNFNYQEIWHTENDVFNNSIPEYQEHTSTVTAIVALGLANMSKLLPRDEVYK